MNNKIHQIIDQISDLEDELNTLLDQQHERLRYRIEGKRITFERAIREAHQRVKVGVFRYLASARPQNLLTAPIIYGMFAPLVLFDLCVSVYQAICFPIYGIARARRSDYIVFDHQHLAYLNIIEKVNCIFCSYAVGLLSYAGEIAARTEQYFCPIKHAKKMLNANARYKHFLAYGDADNYPEKLEEFRSTLAQNNKNNKNGKSGQ